jgi:hypothetical protein
MQLRYTSTRRHNASGRCQASVATRRTSTDGTRAPRLGRQRPSPSASIALQVLLKRHAGTRTTAAATCTQTDGSGKVAKRRRHPSLPATPRQRQQHSVQNTFYISEIQKFTRVTKSRGSDSAEISGAPETPTQILRKNYPRNASAASLSRRARARRRCAAVVQRQARQRVRVGGPVPHVHSPPLRHPCHGRHHRYAQPSLYLHAISPVTAALSMSPSMSMRRGCREVRACGPLGWRWAQ